MKPYLIRRSFLALYGFIADKGKIQEQISSKLQNIIADVEFEVNFNVQTCWLGNLQIASNFCESKKNHKLP